MGKDRFDFSEIDAALPAAERMQEKDRLTDALENNYKAVGILSGKVEKLESRLSEILPGLDETVSSLRGASKITIGEDARRTLEQEGEAVCRKMAESINRESACTCMANAKFIHSLMLWKVIGYSAGFLVFCIALTIFTYHKLKR